MKRLLIILCTLLSFASEAQTIYIPANADSLFVPVQIMGSVRKVYVTDLIKSKVSTTKHTADSTLLRGLINTNTSAIAGLTGAGTLTSTNLDIAKFYGQDASGNPISALGSSIASLANSATLLTLTGATPSWNVSTSRYAKDSATSNVSITTTNKPVPAGFVLFFIQDGTGNRTLTIDGSTVAVNPTALSRTMVSIGYDGVNAFYHPSFLSASAGSTALGDYDKATGATPTQPTEGVTVFSQQKSYQHVLASISANGTVTEYGSSPHQRFIMEAWPSLSALTISVKGFGSFTNTGTVSMPGLGGVTPFGAWPKGLYTSAATAASVTTGAPSAGSAVRGNGYVCTIRWATGTRGTTGRGFFGLMSTVMTDVNPSTQSNTAMFGVAYDAGEANYSLLTNDASGSPVKTALTDQNSAGFPTTNSQADVYVLTLFCTKDDTGISYFLDRTSSDDVHHYKAGRVTTSADIPSSTTGLAPRWWVSNGGTAEAVTFYFLPSTLEIIPR